MQGLVESLLLEVSTVEASDGSAYYFPIAQGRYEVKPGLISFGSCLGNGQLDQQVFQIDGNFAHYRQCKLLARGERLNKYYQTCNYSPDLAGAIAQLLVHRLTLEHPQHFHTESLANGEVAFKCQLSGETLYLDANWQLQQVQTQGSPVQGATSALECFLYERYRP